VKQIYRNEKTIPHRKLRAPWRVKPEWRRR